MLSRFLKLRKSFEFIDESLKDFDWPSIQKLCDILQPWKDCTLELQKQAAGK